MKLKPYLVSQSLALADPDLSSKKSVLYSTAFTLADMLHSKLYKYGYASSLNALQKLHNKYLGQRCFIIGNGPSLNQTDLSLLKNEFSFGLNRIYLLFEKLNFRTSFYVSVNSLVLEQFGHEIEKLDQPKFIMAKHASFLHNHSNTVFLNQLVHPQFSTDLTLGVWEGATVTFVAMQLAYWLGFTKVYLIGVDHNFSTQGPSHQLITSSAADANHFDPNYFGKGVKWHLPDLKTSEYAYQMAKITFETDNRGIFDATIGGKLQVFPKVNYQSLFERQK